MKLVEVFDDSGVIEVMRVADSVINIKRFVLTHAGETELKNSVLLSPLGRHVCFLPHPCERPASCH